MNEPGTFLVIDADSRIVLTTASPAVATRHADHDARPCPLKPFTLDDLLASVASNRCN
jgi:hypothetical protein